ncbi:hypothetical protein D3C85_882120 [compost metagenome]
MAFESVAYKNRLSDLIVNEYEPSVGFCRESINVTPPAASAPVTLGTVVYRVKSLDPAAAWTVLDADTALVATNEFAVVFGDEYGFKESYIPNTITANEFNSVAIRRGPVVLKEYYLKAITMAAPASLSAAEFITLKELLKLQGIVCERTL